MGRPVNDMPPSDPGERAAQVIDMFADGRGGGQNKGVHHLLAVLQKNDKGVVQPTLANVLLILAHDPPLAGMVGYDEFNAQHLILRSPPPSEDGEQLLPGPYPRVWGVADVALVQAYLQRIWSGRITQQTVEQAMVTAAERRRFHPVRDWLATLRWDSTPRLDTWLRSAFGCPDDDYHAAIGAKFLIAAVRRVRQPGCKFDHMPVLEGAQGIGKSRACQALFGERWFSDAIPEDLASRDAALGLLGVWGLEFAEIQHLIRNEVETIKAFLSRSTDRYRPPYAKNYVERPRQGVLIGTTNADDYLRDTSGNRRIWPVLCVFADADWVEANRQQLWAEAAAREASGEALWLADTDAREQATARQAERMSEDVWHDLIHDSVAQQMEIRVPDILTATLGIPRERQGKREEMRVAAILTALGWERRLVRAPGDWRKPRRAWFRKTEPPLPGSGS